MCLRGPFFYKEASSHRLDQGDTKGGLMHIEQQQYRGYEIQVTHHELRRISCV
jgi:hypothetical protein